MWTKLPMKKWCNKNKAVIAGALTGSLLGFLYWQFIGCASGSCMITSKPVNSTLYGALVGAVLFSAIFDKTKTKES